MPRKSSKPDNTEFKLDDGDSVATNGSGVAGGESGGASNNGNGATVVDADTILGNAPTGTGSTATGASGDIGNDGQQPKRRRGRPAGSTNKAKSLPSDVSGIEKLLVGIHTGIAILAGAPEFHLDTEAKEFDGKTEAQYLAQSIKDVADHYALKFLDQKTIDWINLIQALGMVYGTRFFAIRERRKMERRNRPVGPQPVRPANPTQQTMPERPPQSNGAAEARMGIIPGVGPIDFPADHPLAPKG